MPPILDFTGAKVDGDGGDNWCYRGCKAKVKLPSGFLPQKSLKIQGFSRPFHSTIQVQFKLLLPVHHSIAYDYTGTQEKKDTLF